MGEVFSEVLNVSIQGSIVILVVMALRLVLKKVPKSTICLLWLLAGLRLLLPFQIETSFSLQPDRDVVTRLEWSAGEKDATPARGEILDKNGEVIVKREPSVPAKGEILDKDGEVLVEKPLTPAQTSAKESWDWEDIAGAVWLAGVVTMGIYTAMSYWQLKRKVSDGVILEEGVWVTGRIHTPFLLGFLRPQIYLPANLTEQERGFVLAHERAHIARRDHWWKLLGSIALAVHWFDPVVWVGYVLLCRDLEMACDEAVVKSMDVGHRKAYSAALLSCSARRTSIGACPIAFAEVSVKDRIRKVLNYKKPGFWITLFAVAAIVFVAVFFLTSPGMTEEEILECLYQQIEQMQNNETKHLTYTIEMDSEFEYITEQHHEVWVSGDDWYHAIAYETPMGGFTEGYMQLDGIQYAMDHSDEIEGFENRPWAEIPEENYSTLPGLLRNDFSELEVVEVRKEKLDDGGAFSVVLLADSQTTHPNKTYQDEYTFRLDREGELIGITKYTHQYVYMRGFGQSGYFDTKSEVTFQILSFVETDYSVRVKEAQRDMEATNEKEKAELEALLELKEAERLAKGIPPDLLWQCKHAVEEFQDRGAVCIMMDNQYTGDIANDSSTTEYYRNGKDWMIRVAIEDDGGELVSWAMEVDGEYRERRSGEMKDPAYGEDWDTGWVADVDGKPCIPWLSTVKWDDLLITAAKVERQEDLSWCHLTVYGSPYGMEEVKEYQVTFVFRGDVFLQVILEYTKTWNDGKCSGHVVSTMRPGTMLPEEVDQMIEMVQSNIAE